MKTNNKSLVRKLMTGIALLMVPAVIMSCKKDDVDVDGSANLKVVNASSASSAQSFHVAGSAVVTGGLEFGEASNYVAANSGNNLELQFKNEGSNANYASERVSFNNGGYYTVFLAGDGESARIKVFPDDMSAPASGKAKVRFVHLADAGPANVDIRSSATANVVANLARNNASNYVMVDPGVMSLRVYAAGGTDNSSNFDLSAFAAGKIYTVYITGSTSGNIDVRQTIHN